MQKHAIWMGITVASFVLAAGSVSAQTTREGVVDHRESEAQQNETVPAQRGESQNETVPAQRGTPNNETVPAERGTPNSETVPARRGTLSVPSDLVLWRVGRTDLTLIWMDNASFEFGVEVERGIPTRERGGVNYNFERLFNVEERVESRVEGTGMRTDADDGLQPDTQYCYRLRAYRGDTVSDYSEPECTRTQP